MQYPDSQNELRYQYEVLRTKLEIRDHYFKTMVRDIYEKTGQILSLVQIQLAMVESQINNDITVDLATPRSLVGSAIGDLRDMSRNFFPEDEILSESGLVTALKRELTGYSTEDLTHKIKVKGIPFALSDERCLIFFLIILQMVTVIVNEYGAASLEMLITYSTTKLKISMSYSGSPIYLNNSEKVHHSTSSTFKPAVQDRLNLIGGKMVVKANTGKKVQIDLSIPYNNCKAA